MKTLVLVISLLPFFSSTSSADSRERFAGTTQTEREIRWGWKYLKAVAHSCLESKTECQDADVRKAVTELDGYLPDSMSVQMKDWSSLLTFVSEKDHPGVFTSVDGDPHRLAITELKKNSPVMINIDRMNRPLEDWVGLLAHEATHHLGYTDDQTRLPDRVATEMTNHFKKRTSISTLAQFHRADARNLLFNPTASGPAVGFFSSAEGTFDVEWGQTSLAQLCAPGESIAREFVGNPVWTIEYMNKKTGVVSVRGGGFVNVMCRPGGTTGAQDRVQRWLMLAAIELQYAQPLNIATWTTETPAILITGAQLGASTNPADVMWGPNKSFWVTSVKHENSKLTAGDTWRTEVVVKSTDGFVPPVCEIYLSGSQWPHEKHIGLPAVDIFNNCTVTKLATDQYQLTATYKMPTDMQPDDFYISAIRFPSPTGDHFAFPSSPSYVRVESPAAAKPALIKSVTVLGLKTAEHLQELPLMNSYQVIAGQTFQIEVTVEGDQAITDLQVELPMWVSRAGDDRAPIFVNGPMKDFPQLFGPPKITRVPGGSKIVIDVLLPTSLAGYPIMAMKFMRFYFRTSDFAYCEYANPSETDGWIVNSQFAK